MDTADLKAALEKKRHELGMFRDDLTELKYELDAMDDTADKAEDALIDCIDALSELV